MAWWRGTTAGTERPLATPHRDEFPWTIAARARYKHLARDRGIVRVSKTIKGENRMFRKFDLRALRAGVVALAFAASLTGCLTTKMYVDPKLPVVAKQDLAPADAARPVQVVFEFRTNGKPNARATKEVRQHVLSVANQSGMFTTVTETPAQDADTLNVVIDNVADRGEAAKKGFGTGLTLGLNGTTVTDGYVCTVVYTRNGKVVETKVEHAIHSTIGNEKAPAGLAPLQPAQAVQQVMTQMMWNALNNLSQQHAFQ